MPALKPRIEKVYRVLLIAIILSNALVPTTAMAMGSNVSTPASASESSVLSQISEWFISKLSASLFSSKNSDRADSLLVTETPTLDPLAAPVATETSPTVGASITPLQETGSGQETSIPSATIEATSTGTPVPTQQSDLATGSDLTMEFSASPTSAKMGDRVTLPYQSPITYPFLSRVCISQMCYRKNSAALKVMMQASLLTRILAN